MNYYNEIKTEILNNEITKRVKDVKLKYTERTLRRIRQFYLFCATSKWSTLSTKLTWSHFCELLKINDSNEIKFYITISEQNNLSVRELRERIKNKEYE